LRGVAQSLLSACKRPADLVARYGGEEFVMLLPQTPRHGAQHIAQHVVDSVAAFGIFHADSQTTHYVTVSVGIGCFDDAGACRTTENTLCPGDLVAAADKALYSAKQAGRAQAKLRDVSDCS
jgi:diguanylate cyclase (GGDEF)-like protein